VNDLEPVRQRVGPRGPGIATEPRETRGSVGVRDVGRVALGGEREPTLGRLDPRVEPVDEHDPPGGGRGRHGERRVIAARADAVDASKGEAAEPVGFEPLCGGSESLLSFPAERRRHRGARIQRTDEECSG
jgi:hypothetical protein